jgi:hypothetical protein
MVYGVVLVCDWVDRMWLEISLTFANAYSPYVDRLHSLCLICPFISVVHDLNVLVDPLTDCR